MKYKIYYIVGIFVVIAIAVVLAIFLTSKGKGSVIEITTPSKEKVFQRSSSIILGPGTSQNLYFHKAGWFIKKIEFRLPGFTGDDFEIKALVTTKGEKPEVEDWTKINKKIFCLNNRDEKLKDLVLTLTNKSASSTLKEEIQVIAMREGCDQWSGTFKYEWSDKKENKNEQGILQAVFTLKENAYATEFIAADGGYSYNLLGCSQEDKTRTYTVIGDGALHESMIRLVPQEDGTYKLKLTSVWGKSDNAKEYVKRKPVCIYGKEYGDTVNILEEYSIKTLKEVLLENLILTPDSITGNLKGKKDIVATLEDGTVRTIKLGWDLVRQ